MDRRKILTLGIAASTMPLSGCFPSRLASDIRYEERVNGVFISNDKKTLAVIGDEYHYIFDAHNQVIAALNPILHSSIRRATFGEFHVDGESRISGSLELYTNRNLTEEQKALASGAGFRVENNDEMTTSVRLSGTRYRAKEGERPVVERLNTEYVVHVTAEPSIGGKLARAAATPIAFAADGVVIIGAVVLSPIWLPMLLGKACFVCK